MREVLFYLWGEVHLNDVCYEGKEDVSIVLKKEGEISFWKYGVKNPTLNNNGDRCNLLKYKVCETPKLYF